MKTGKQDGNLYAKTPDVMEKESGRRRPPGRRTLAVLEGEHTRLYSKYNDLLDQHAQLVSKHNDLLAAHRNLQIQFENLQREFSPRRFLRQFIEWLGHYTLAA